jgi:hypothetical protein
MNNSRAEMHAEIEERDRAKHTAEVMRITLQDELALFDRQVDELQRQTALLRQRVGSIT